MSALSKGWSGPLQPGALAIRNDFDHIDLRAADGDDPSIVTPQVIADFQPMHTARPAQQRKGTRCIGEGADHFKLLDVEAFEVLLDPPGSGLTLREPCLTRQIDSDLPGERASQVGGVVSECRVRPEYRRWFNLARRIAGALRSCRHPDR